MQTYRNRDEAIEAAQRECEKLQENPSYGNEAKAIGAAVGRINRRYTVLSLDPSYWEPGVSVVGVYRPNSGYESFTGK